MMAMGAPTGAGGASTFAKMFGGQLSTPKPKKSALPYTDLNL
jgi:hypothetical protein